MEASPTTSAPSLVDSEGFLIVGRTYICSEALYVYSTATLGPEWLTQDSKTLTLLNHGMPPYTRIGRPCVFTVVGKKTVCNNYTITGDRRIKTAASMVEYSIILFEEKTYLLEKFRYGKDMLENLKGYLTMMDI